MAEGIVDILKKEIDALTLTLFELVKKRSPLREQISATLTEAYTLFVEAEMISGSKRIKEASLVAQPINFKISEETEKGVLNSLYADSCPGIRYLLFFAESFIDCLLNIRW